jgi:hypothetical protein
MNKKKQQPWVWFSLDALFPYGFRKVQKEHPLVWVMAHNLEKDDRRIFQEHLTNRLRGKGGDLRGVNYSRRVTTTIFAGEGSAKERRPPPGGSRFVVVGRSVAVKDVSAGAPAGA